MLDDRVKRIALEEKRREDKKKVAAAARAAKKAKKDAADIAAGKKPRKARQPKGKQAVVPDTLQDPSTTGQAAAGPSNTTTSPGTSNMQPEEVNAGASQPTIEPGEPDEGPEPPFSLHPDDLKNFLKLSAALQLLSQRVINDEDINTADRLLREYNTELITVRFHLLLLDLSTDYLHP